MLGGYIGAAASLAAILGPGWATLVLVVPGGMLALGGVWMMTDGWGHPPPAMPVRRVIDARSQEAQR